MFRNTRHSWGLIAKSFHWAIALLIFVQFGLGWVADEMRVSPQKIDLLLWHKSFGIMVLLLVILRAAWRSANSPPVPPGNILRWEKRFAQAGHGLLYLLTILVPLTGWLVSDTSRIPFKLFHTLPVPDFMEANRELSELAGEVHEALTSLLLVVVGLHVLAALWHHFILHNDILLRMLPFRREKGN